MTVEIIFVCANYKYIMRMQINFPVACPLSTQAEKVLSQRLNHPFYRQPRRHRLRITK
jgi:hypothetical protein